jgi:hypothetical protein
LILLPFAEVAVNADAQTLTPVQVFSPFDANFLQVSGPNGNAGLEIVLFQINDDVILQGIGADAYHPSLEVKSWLSGIKGKSIELAPAHHSVKIRIKNNTGAAVKFSAYIDGIKYKTI